MKLLITTISSSGSVVQTDSLIRNIGFKHLMKQKCSAYPLKTQRTMLLPNILVGICTIDSSELQTNPIGSLHNRLYINYNNHAVQTDSFNRESS